MNAYIISTPRLGLRHWLDADLAPFIDMNSDREVMEFFPEQLTAAQTMAMVERIKGHFEKYHFGLFAVEEKSTNNFIGFTGLAVPTFESFFTPCVEIGWRFKKSAWGQGFATEAANACLQYGFKELQMKTIYSFTSVLNKPSERVMQKIGMHCVADFNHPKIDEAHPLCRHVLYQVNNDAGNDT